MPRDYARDFINTREHKVVTLPDSILNQRSDAMLDKVQAYRIVARIGSTTGDSSGVPPACFFVSAIQALRGDPSERVLILAGRQTEHIVSEVVAMLGSQPFKEEAALHGGAEVKEDGDNPAHLEHTLLSALRVIWGDPTSPLPQPPLRIVPRGEYAYTAPRRRRSYEVVWTWCNAVGKLNESANVCPRLPSDTTDFEVQARASNVLSRVRAESLRKPSLESPEDDGGMRMNRSMTASNDGGRTCRRLLSVRTTWSTDRWHSLAGLTSKQTDRRRSELKRGEWVLDNVCVGYSTPNLARRSDRYNILAQVHATTRQLLWPIPWPDMYAEYTPGWLRLDSQTMDHFLTPLVNASLPFSPLSRCSWVDPGRAAFITQLTMDNLYHALIHALPVREMYARVRRELEVDGGDVHVLPHFTQYWPGSTWASSAPRSFNRSVGWRLLIRSLGKTKAEWDEIAIQAERLTAPGRCNCYRRLYGGHSAFMPPPTMSGTALLQRVADFGGALASSVGVTPVQRRVLFQVRRNGVRQMMNELEVRNAVAADPLLANTVMFTVMEHLPVMEQYALVSSSMALAGMHGMGLAWTMLLPSAASGKSSTLEITGEWKSFGRTDYYALSVANNVHYVRLRQPNWPGCLCRGCNYRTCGNVTAVVSDVLTTLRYQVNRFDHPGEGGGCARHPPVGLSLFGGLTVMGLPCPTLIPKSRARNGDRRKR